MATKNQKRSKSSKGAEVVAEKPAKASKGKARNAEQATADLEAMAATRHNAAVAAHETRKRNGIASSLIRALLNLPAEWSRWNAPDAEYLAVRCLEALTDAELKADTAGKLRKALEGKGDKLAAVRKVERELWPDAEPEATDAASRVYVNGDTNPNPPAKEKSSKRKAKRGE